MPPYTTKRRTATNLKTNKQTKNIQNDQKIKLYGSPKTKELKKKYSSRLVGEVETGSGEEETRSKAVAGGPGRQGCGWSPTFKCR